MTIVPKLAAGALLVAALAGCGQDRGADGLTQDERDRLNAAAESLDNGADVVDASPDSLVANDEWTAAESADKSEAANLTASNIQ